MSTKKANMQRLLNQRDQLLREAEALRHKIAGLELAISLMSNEGGASSQRKAPTGKQTKSVKAVLLDLLEEVAAEGLNAPIAVETASRRGLSLDRGTVSSLLSRLKRDEALSFDGQRYRLKKYEKTGQNGLLSGQAKRVN